jgi:hypothetical protein
LNQELGWQLFQLRRSKFGRLVVFPDSLAKELAGHAARVTRQCTANKLAVAPGVNRVRLERVRKESLEMA